MYGMFTELKKKYCPKRKESKADQWREPSQGDHKGESEPQREPLRAADLLGPSGREVRPKAYLRGGEKRLGGRDLGGERGLGGFSWCLSGHG